MRRLQPSQRQHTVIILLRAFYGDDAREIKQRVDDYLEGRADNPAAWLTERFGPTASAKVMGCYLARRQ